MDLQEIKQILNSEAGKSLKEFLINQINQLADIDNVREYSDAKAQTIELKAQMKAFRKVKDIFGKIIGLEEYKEEKPEKDRYDA